MPPQPSAVASRKIQPDEEKKFLMPSPAPVVTWRPARCGEPSFAIVTGVGKSAISVMVFPPDSRVGVPKSAVRHVDDPLNVAQGNSDSGVWEYTDETRVLQSLLAKTGAGVSR